MNAVKNDTSFFENNFSNSPQHNHVSQPQYNKMAHQNHPTFNNPSPKNVSKYQDFTMIEEQKFNVPNEHCMLYSHLGHKNLKTLIDTGAGLSYIEKRFIDEQKIGPLVAQLTAANGSQIKHHGVIENQVFRINHHAFVHDFIVVDQLNGYNMVLGGDFMKEYSVNINFDSVRISAHYNNEVIPLNYTDAKHSFTQHIPQNEKSVNIHSQTNDTKPKPQPPKKNKNKPKQQNPPKPKYNMNTLSHNKRQQTHVNRQNKFVYSDDDYIILPKSESTIKCNTKLQTGGTFNINRKFLEEKCLFPQNTEYDKNLQTLRS